MPGPQYTVSSAEFRRMLETEFARTMHPSIHRKRSIATETGRTLAFVKRWFKKRRLEEAASNPATPEPATTALPPASYFLYYLNHGPDWHYGMPLDREVTVEMGNTFGVKRVPGSMEREATGWIFVPEKTTVTLPKPELCYSGTLAAEIENQENEEISKEDEANFMKVLRIKLKCGICVSGAITVRCPSCFSGLCGDCVTGLVKHSHAPLNCPYCRCEDQRSPFEPVSMPRI